MRPDKCYLYDRTCIDCGECDRCDIHPEKPCTNCMLCVNNRAAYRGIRIDAVILDSPEMQEYEAGAGTVARADEPCDDRER